MFMQYVGKGCKGPSLVRNVKPYCENVEKEVCNCCPDIETGRYPHRIQKSQSPRLNMFASDSGG